MPSRLPFVVLALLCGVSSLDAQSPRLVFRSSTITTLERAPQAAIIDTIVTAAQLTLTRAQPDSAGRAEAVLIFDSLRVSSGGMVRRTAGAATQGRVSLLLDGGRFQPSVLDSLGVCAERPLLGLLADLTPGLPDSLAEGVAWSDTVRTMSCRAQVPIETTLAARYLVRASADTSVWLVDRVAEITVMGRVTLREQAVTLDGTGTGTALYEVMKRTRALRSWRNSQMMETTISNGQQTRVLRQATTETVLP
jgi:hypothetical protein